MAKITCPSCGFKNKSREKICTKCGFYLAQDQIAPAFKTSSSAVPAPAETPVDIQRKSEGGSSTIQVRDTTGAVGKVMMAASYVLLFALLGLIYLVNLNPIFVFPVLIVVWAAAPVIRRRFSGIKYSPDGFTVKGKNSERNFTYDSIVSGEVQNAARGRRFLQLSLKNVPEPVTMEFFSFNTFRFLVMQMTKRGISIKPERQETAQKPARMM